MVACVLYIRKMRYRKKGHELPLVMILTMKLKMSIVALKSLGVDYWQINVYPFRAFSRQAQAVK